jgi:opacity protein-like surface antigen
MLKINGFKAGNDVNTDDKVAIPEMIKSRNLTSFSYQAGLGVGYEMSKDILLDVGYKLSCNTGQYKFKTKNNLVEPVITESNINPKQDKFGTPKLRHTVTTGVRVSF